MVISIYFLMVLSKSVVLTHQNFSVPTEINDLKGSVGSICALILQTCNTSQTLDTTLRTTDVW